MPDEALWPPIINVTGEKVALGPLRRDLLPLYLKWINDFEVTRTLAVGMRPIYERAALRPIGATGLHAIDHVNRIADFGIMIGEKDCWGKGYGTEATSLVLDYAFNALGLHNVMLRVYGDHERAIRAYTRAGFRVMGRRREAHRTGGAACDEIYMDCLATEFQRPASRRAPGGG